MLRIEILKTLPVSNRVLFVTKILPRLVILFVPILGFTVYGILTNDSDTTDILFLFSVPAGISIITILIYGFFLGISDRRNPVLIAVITLLSSYPLMLGPVISQRITRYLVHHIHPEHPIFPEALVYFMSVVVFALIPLFLLVPVYRSWDAAPGRMRSQTILKKLAIPSILVIVLWSFVLTL